MNVISTMTFLNSDGSQAKAPYVLQHSGDKVKKVEGAMNEVLQKLHALTDDEKKKHGNTNPVTVVFHQTVMDGSTLFSDAKFMWPNMGDEKQAVLRGMLDGALAKVK